MHEMHGLYSGLAKQQYSKEASPAIRLMSTEIIDAEKGYGFTLTRFAGGKERGRCYQITMSDGSSVQLTAWQMIQLFATLLVRANAEGL